MSRYETILYGLLDRVTPGMTPEELEQLAEPLIRLNEKEKALAAAYKVCGCGAQYSETQWANLLPAVAREWQLDDYVREEWRECSQCLAPLAILERNGKRRGPDTMPFTSVSSAYHCCGNGACLLTIKPGQVYVERLERRNGMRALGRWAFCSKECEAW